MACCSIIANEGHRCVAVKNTINTPSPSAAIPSTLQALSQQETSRKTGYIRSSANRIKSHVKGTYGNNLYDLQSLILSQSIVAMGYPFINVRDRRWKLITTVQTSCDK